MLDQDFDLNRDVNEKRNFEKEDPPWIVLKKLKMKVSCYTTKNFEFQLILKR